MGCAPDAEAFASAGFLVLGSGFLGLPAFFRYWPEIFQKLV
jgi:hypothetical protein